MSLRLLHKKYKADYLLYCFPVFFLILLSGQTGFTQLQITGANESPYTPINLIENIFLGGGVKIIDVQYEGEAFSVGYFDHANAEIKLDRGIVMTTGEAKIGAGSNSASNTSSHSSGINYTDNDLVKALGLDPNTPNLLRDIARYTIKFIPYADSLNFNYVFASEEYPDYACSKFKDVFGFFISGPNPNGLDYQAKNLALVPGTGETVSISNVNNGDESTPGCFPHNPQFYNDNSGGQHLTYNAYLDIFTAGIKVIPCREYVIKMVISDVADALYDSAVFLEAKSFVSSGLNIELFTPGPESSIVEACTEAMIKFSFEDSVKEDFAIDVQLIETTDNLPQATKDLDFIGFPDQLIIPKGKKEASFNLSAIADNITESEEWIFIDYQKNECQRDTIRLSVKEKLMPAFLVPDSLNICAGDSISIDISLPPDYQLPESKSFYNPTDYTISPIDEPVYSEIEVFGLTPKYLGPGILSKVCIDTAWNSNLEDFDIFLFSPGGKFMELSTDNGKRTAGGNTIDSLVNTCFTPLATSNINLSNPKLGFMDLSNPNFSGDYEPEGVWSDLWPDDEQPSNGIWKLMLIDDKNAFVGHLESWSISFNSTYKIGYHWSPQNNFIGCSSCEDPIVYPEENTAYFFSATDSYGCKFQDTTAIIVKEIPPVTGLSCDSISSDFIRFSWLKSADYDNYAYQLNEIGEWAEITDTFFTVSGLEFDETIIFSIRAIGTTCRGTIASVSCQTLPCAGPTISLTSISKLDCYGDTNGAIDIEASGSIGPYIYNLGQESNTDGIFDQLDGGTDTIFVTDGANCKIPYIFEINQPDSIKIAIQKTKITCRGMSDGALKAIPIGGNGNYSFDWTDDFGQLSTNKLISQLGPGNYSISVVDQKGCDARKNILLADPPVLEIEGHITDVLCKGDPTGAIELEISGGHGNYSYHWTGVDSIYTSEDLIGIPGGVYNLHLVDKGLCTLDSFFIVTEPEQFLDFYFSGKDTLCFGTNDAYLEMHISGGTGAYSINWNTGDNTTSLSDLGSGLYAVVVVDENACEVSGRKEIIALGEINFEMLQHLPGCFNSADGSIEVQHVYYGTKSANLNSFSYVWNTLPAQYTPFAKYLEGGKSYRLTVTDSYGCTGIDSITLGQTEALSIQIIQQNDVSCFGYNDGLFQLQAEGGKAPYSYNWGANAAYQTGATAKNLATGVYRVDITDSLDCESSFDLNIEGPDPISLGATVHDIPCFGEHSGSINLTIFGGTPPYQAIWGNGETGLDLEKLAPGVQKVILRDANMCERADSFFISQPDEPLSVMAESMDATCYEAADGQIALEAVGGTPPYSYMIENRPMQGGAEFYKLKAGVYTGYTIDAKSCIDSIEQIWIDQGEPLLVNLGKDTTIMHGDRIQLFPIINRMDSADLQYTWRAINPGTLSCTDCSDPIITTDIPERVYLLVKDDKACMGEDDINIFVKTDRRVAVPTGFSPNGDGQNDLLSVFGAEGTIIKSFYIFNNWGEKLYEKHNFPVNDEANGWDGTYSNELLNPGVYTWVIEAMHIDGSLRIYKGNTSLIK